MKMNVIVCLAALMWASPSSAFNPEHLDRLYFTNECERCDLTDAILTSVDLRNARLREARLTGADLSGANLSGADLTRASLRNANLTGAILTKTILTAADMTGAITKNANLEDAHWKKYVAPTEYWLHFPVFLKHRGSGKYIGLKTFPHHPFNVSLYGALNAARTYAHTGDPIAWRFKPGNASGTFEIVGRPTPAIAPRADWIEDYLLCGRDYGGFTLQAYRPAIMNDRSTCSWTVEQVGPNIRLRNHGLDTKVGRNVGRLACDEWSCAFDGNKHSDTSAAVLFEFKLQAE